MVKKQTKKKSKASINIKINDIDKLVNKAKNCAPIDTSCGGFFYFLGFLGAAIYYISTATGFWIGVLGFLKAIIWPAFLIFELMKFLGL